MDRSALVLGIAAVFAGLTVLMTALAARYGLFLLVVVVPFGLTSYVMWAHATGRMDRRAHRAASDRADRRARGRTAGDGPGAFGRSRRRARGDRGTAGGDGGVGPRPPDAAPELSRREAAGVLGVDVDADPERIKRAYRERAKTVHPDADGGDSDRFKRLNDAYEVLS
ncbi:molecular chaperone DnaJ [Halobacteriales archaeon SW_7_68_16]|nr:MAG: molecular chaperone DnaJ [Halobacteriales archaeon SW_7_68_16]